MRKNIVAIDKAEKEKQNRSAVKKTAATASTAEALKRPFTNMNGINVYPETKIDIFTCCQGFIKTTYVYELNFSYKKVH